MAWYDNALGSQSWLDIGEDNHITYRFADDYGRDWTEAEKATFRSALETWASVVNVTFEEVATGGDLVQHLVTKPQLNAALGTSKYNGWHEEPTVGGSNAYYVHTDPYWDALDPGGHGYWIFVHEIGHALGLEHPHSTWHGSTTFPGVDRNQDPGRYGLNDVRYTVMSYRHGHEHGFTEGGPAGPMALDIATAQKMYGANTTTGAGDDTYELGDDRYWSSIWDVGGWDEIVFTGSGNATIDLRAATLQMKPGGGGFLSKGDGELMTIAAGVTIEAATGGDGNDTLIGNGSDNMLNGGAGNDVLRGLGGADTLSGGSGADRFDFDRVSHVRGDTITDFERGLDRIDLRTIDAKTGRGNDTFRWIGERDFHGRKGELRYETMGDNVIVEGDRNGDGMADFQLLVEGLGALNKNDFLL